MNDTEYISAYFESSLSATERKAFEDRCISDAAFTKEVAHFVMMRDALKVELHNRKRAEFAKLYTELTAAGLDEEPITLSNEGPRPYRLFKKLPLYAAAACVGLIATWLIFFRNPEPEDLATNYITANLTTLGVTMGGPADNATIQRGVVAYNKGDMDKAIEIFNELKSSGQLKPEALKYLGLAQLSLSDYEDALRSFDELSQMKLFTNPGLFYKALTLMKRGQDGDRQEAKKCLELVIEKNLAGRDQAEEWLKKL